MKSREVKRLRILDFDIENRPLSYLGMDWTSAEVTAIGWSWIGSPGVETLLLRADGQYQYGRQLFSPTEALKMFALTLAAADVVTGHYITRHDLPIINGALMELGLFPLPPLRASDTKCHLIRTKDLSKSQENLASMFGMAEAKHHMTQSEWRTANRLTGAGLKAARKRVVDDVIQHKALRAELIRRELLGPPQVWRP